MRNLVDLVLDQGLLWVFQCLLEKLDLLFCFTKLLDHSSLLKNRMRLQQVVASLVRADHCANRFRIGVVSHDYHENADDLLRFCQLCALVSVEVNLQLLDLLELTKRVFEVAPPDVNKSNVALDLARSDVLHTVAALVDLKSLLQVDKSLTDLTALLLPGAQLRSDPCNEICTLELL